MNSILKKLITWIFGIFIFVLGLSILSESVFLALPLLIEGFLITPVIDALIQKRLLHYSKWKLLITIVFIPGCFTFSLLNYNYVAKIITNSKIKKLGGFQIINVETIKIFDIEKNKFGSTSKVGDLLTAKDAPLLSELGNNVKYSNSFRYEIKGHKQEPPHIYISCGGLLTFYNVIIYDPRDTIESPKYHQGLEKISHNAFIKRPNPITHFIHYFNTK